MDRFHSYLEKHAEEMGRSTAQAAEEFSVAAAKLVKHLTRPSEKSTSVIRKASQEQQQGQDRLKITRKDSPSPDIDSRQQADDAIAQLKTSLANQPEVKNLKVKVDETEYTVNKYRGGSIQVESADSKVFARPNKNTLFSGDENQIASNLPRIAAAVNENLNNANSNTKQQSKSEVLYGFDRNNNFVDRKMSQQDAAAILEIMDAKEGDVIKSDSGKNILIEYGSEKLFETDAKGKVTHNAFDREPKLNGGKDLRDSKGITTLQRYAERIASKPQSELQIERAIVNPELKSSQQVKSAEPIAALLNRGQPPQPSRQTATTAELVERFNERIVQPEFSGRALNRRASKEIEGIQVNRNKPATDGSYSVTIKPEGSKETVKLGVVDRVGKFTANTQLDKRSDVRASVEKVLQTRGISTERSVVKPIATASSSGEAVSIPVEGASGSQPQKPQKTQSQQLCR